MNFAAQTIEWLVEAGYTSCFFVAGGNIMHLLNAARGRMRCIPFVHEVGAGIAAEYFNEVSPNERAFVLVTAGPGVTNVLTAMAGAWLESRDLLVLAGQVKTSDLARGEVRQRGIQEIDGVAAARPFAKIAERLDVPWSRERFFEAVAHGRLARKGPIFLEYPLDVQGAAAAQSAASERALPAMPAVGATEVATARAASDDVIARIRRARRPVVLIGGGVTRKAARALAAQLAKLDVATMTTWNGCDRIAADAQNYFGRPNTWGMRFANVLIQQSDLIVALGTRLGLQQTGFNWQAFGSDATIVQVDVDPAELAKGHPHVAVPICGDADTVLAAIAEADCGEHAEWLEFARSVRAELPLVEANETAPGYLDPYEFVTQLSSVARRDDLVVPCSSGGAFTTMMQAFRQRLGQDVVTDKGLASMGYGLSAAIGAALAEPNRRTILVEGDGGFTQNLQELATVDVNALDLKIFIYSNEGYASIRMTQRNYFDGAYLGCDTGSGLGFPRWPELFAAYGIPFHMLSAGGLDGDERAAELLGARGPAAIVVPIDPEQTYFPKIASRVTASGSMESAPLDAMSPPLAPEVEARVLRYGRFACQPSS